jgi:hypothetical protein
MEAKFGNPQSSKWYVYNTLETKPSFFSLLRSTPIDMTSAKGFANGISLRAAQYLLGHSPCDYRSDPLEEQTATKAKETATKTFLPQLTDEEWEDFYAFMQCYV